MVDSFIYTRLPEGSIRLLRFSTTSPGTPSCTLDTVSLDNPPGFYALSYTWGSPTRTESILCNGLEMKIAANLHQAIQTLFNPPLSLELPFWIDAICINQDDDGEKSRQVGRMGDVYRKAKKVAVWLGPAEDDSDLAMKSLGWLSTAFLSLHHTIHENKLEDFGLPRGDSPIWPALDKLYSRAWFSRLWTFQEVVLAPEIQVVCGKQAVEGTVLLGVGRGCMRLSYGTWVPDFRNLILTFLEFDASSP